MVDYLADYQLKLNTSACDRLIFIFIQIFFLLKFFIKNYFKHFHSSYKFFKINFIKN